MPLARVAAFGERPYRTLQRWLADYRRDGLAGLARRPRRDAGRRRMPQDLQLLIAGLALQRPPPTIATAHRRVAAVAAGQGLASAQLRHRVRRHTQPGSCVGDARPDSKAIVS
ncbi:hypothetical protein [Nonomuraea wenchangensis]|uniref:hypothetical protein n=1 Tax=Nonomuraea wenchangensis TaxID=568860 RepID=UPI0015A63E12